jgi:hypothetical protein
MEKEAKTFYSYAMASPVMYKKPTMEIREWAGDSPETTPTGEKERY